MASIVDGLILGAVLLSLWVVGLVLIIPSGEAGGFLVAGFLVVSFLVLFGYDTAFETLASGRTPGKRAAGLRVVRYGGEPPGFTTAAVRNLLRLVDILPGFYAVGALFVFFTPRNQRVGDLAAGTLVVRERRPLPITPARLGPVSEAPYLGWDVSGITVAEAAAVRRFLDRRHQLDPGARYHLALELADRLRPRVPGAPGHVGPEQFLEGLAAAKAARS